MSICKVNMKSIPLEKDLDWWWYRAKDNLLRHTLSKENRDRYKNILEIEKYFRIIGINPKFGISIYASFVKK